MGQQVSVETFSSTADSNGNKYWASFDPYPFKVGHKKLAFMGMMNGNGPLKGQKCVVKTLRRGTLSRKEWMLESQRSRVAMEMANDYNKMVSGNNFKYKLAVTLPITAEIDSLSDCMCINDILGKPKKNLKETDFVAIELYLRGRFEEFEYGLVDPRALLTPEAFSHFTWCRSEGSLIVSNLQGVKTENMYHFTSPVIHSENNSYGNSDLGYEGIKGFFRLHKCNRICHSWPRLGDGTDLTGWGEFLTYRDQTPSAPSMMMVPPPYHEVERVPSYRELPLGYQYQNGQDNQPGFGNNQHFYDHRATSIHGLQPAYQYENRQVTQHHPYDDLNQFRPRHMNGGQGMMVDWREMAGIFGSPGYNQNIDQPTEMQFMWFAKFMRSYSYKMQTPGNPPPPYCTCVERHGVNAIDYVSPSIHTESDFEDDNDEKFLLPPPYREESVDPRYDCVTYL